MAERARGSHLRLVLIVLSLIGAAVTLSGQAAGAATFTIRPTDWGLAPGEWHEANARDGGVSVVSDVTGDRLGGAGSLDQRLPAPAANSPKTDAQIFASDTQFVAGNGFSTSAGGFGLLSELDAISFDWQRASSSTAPAHLTPALRLWLWDPDAGANGTSTLAIWEGVYNGYPIAGGPVPTDVWTAEDLRGDNFWQIPQFIDGVFSGIGGCGPVECFVFDRGLADWGYGPNTQVFGVEVGLGSGWAGSYQGAADLVTVGFGGADPTTWDFEPDVAELTLTSVVSPTSLDLATDANMATATLTLSNDGTAPATGVVLVDTVPAGTTPTAIADGGFAIRCSNDGTAFGPCPADLSSVVAIEWAVGSLAVADPAVNVGYSFMVDLPVSGSTLTNAPTVVDDRTAATDGVAYSLSVQPAPPPTTTPPPTTVAPTSTAVPTTTAQPDIDGDTLPATGSSTAALTISGLALLLVGIAFMSLGRRPRNSSVH